MTTPLLFEVDQRHASRAVKLISFKKEHGIWTYRTSGMARADEPWSALLVPSARAMFSPESDKLEPFDLIANYCRVLDEAHLLVTGEGELTTIRELCKQNNIRCDL
jgi:hypothetical protein